MAVKKNVVVLLTQKEYVNPDQLNAYVENILLEDDLLTKALELQGFTVTRTFWDDEGFDWGSAHFALFRATWDYFYRFDEFHLFLKKRAQQIQFINPYEIIQWNVDKHYLEILKRKGINIPPTLFLEKGELKTLSQLLKNAGWDRAILKPAIAGGARHTYLLDEHNVHEHQDIFQQLISAESMLLQEFQENIVSHGEVSFMVFGGKYSHAVLKKAKAGDFRVQDDFGGSVHPYSASDEEKGFVEHVIAQCDDLPVYARVDVMLDNKNKLCLSELEMIEPELWLRMDESAANAMAEAVFRYCKKK